MIQSYEILYILGRNCEQYRTYMGLYTHGFLDIRRSLLVMWNGEATQPLGENTWASSSHIEKLYSHNPQRTRIAHELSAIWLVCWRRGHGGPIVMLTLKLWQLSGKPGLLLRFLASRGHFSTRENH